MRFKQFIQEEASEELDDFIERQCSSFVNEMGMSSEDAISHRLYRGITTEGEKSGEKVKLLYKGKSLSALIKIVRSDRRPLDTPRLISELTDDAFEDRFGWRPRSQGMFCTGDAGAARTYGNLYQIFPIGDISYIWSPEIYDMSNVIKRVASDIGLPYLAPEKVTRDQKDNFFEEMSEFVDKHYMEAELEKAINKKHEIMLKCSKYLAVPV